MTIVDMGWALVVAVNNLVGGYVLGVTVSEMRNCWRIGWLGRAASLDRIGTIMVNSGAMVVAGA